MRILLTLGLVALTTPVLAATPAQNGPTQVTVNLAPVRGSNQRGTAVLTQRGNTLTVAVHMNTPQGPKMKESGAPMVAKSGPLGAHIHSGSCPHPQKQPLYPLNPVTSGTSTTTLTTTSLNQLTSGAYTVSVHKSTHDPTNPVACGDIKLANPTGTTQ
ncbi:MAG: hypothetical protein JWO85_409 [Candidatus Eremiobacteraeota bacterium]|jgi:hypothetical protein|nr:hypothetical protein [Candidatus Eremiobacteraeota bacterium]